MIIEDLIKKIEDKFPRKNAEYWDNVGLLLGEKKSELKGVVISLDVDYNSIKKAVKEGANLIISHHPFFFKGLKRINFDTVEGEKIRELIKNDINVYSLHTNIDATSGGLNDYLLEKIGVSKSKVLKEGNEKEVGIGRYYKLSEEVSIKEYLAKLKKNLELESLIFYGDENKKCKKIAFVNGSGADFWNQAKFICCDLLITGDVKYHTAFDAVESGLNLVDLGHYESEKFFMDLVEKEILNIDNSLKVYLNKKETFGKIY